MWKLQRSAAANYLALLATAGLGLTSIAQSAAAQRLTPGQTFRDCPTCPEMIVVPAGQFTMGSPRTERSRSREEGPQKIINLAQPFAVGKFEVTFAEWDACVRDGGCRHSPNDKGWGRGSRPVINVSWQQVNKQYLPWLSAKTRQTYRLLSESEWEYVARAGRGTVFWWGNERARAPANCKGCDSRWGGSRTAPVGSFSANPFGLHDLNGNVFEFTADCWNRSHNRANEEGKARPDGNCRRRVIKGGSWYTAAKWLRSAARMSDPISYSNSNVGFRVARSIDAAPMVARAESNRSAGNNAAQSGSYSGGCYRGAAWHGRADGQGTAYAGLTPCRQEEPADILALRCSEGGDRYIASVDYVPRPGRRSTGPFGVQISVDGSTRTFSVKLNDTGMYETLDFEIDRFDPLIDQLETGNRGNISADGKRTRFHLRGSGKAIQVLKAGCVEKGAATMAQRPLNQPVPSKATESALRRAQAVTCGEPEAELARHTQQVSFRVKRPNSKAVPIGTPTTLAWAFNGTLNKTCRRPLYLVVTAPKRTRFEGTGFLAIPGGALGPFDIKHEQDKTRLFFPLHLLDKRQGEFKIKVYEVGALDIEWALVQAKSKVANPRTKADFALGQEYVSDVVRLDNVARYTVGEPKIVVRDNFTLDKPKKVIRSNSGEFDLQVFDEFYRVLDATTGELLIERSGTDPNYSPGSRFVTATVADDFPLEVTDLYSQSQIYRGEASSVAWGNGDTFFAPDEYIGSGAAKKLSTVLKIQQGLIDNSAVLFQNLEYYKTSTTNWLLSIDFEGAVAAVYDTIERLGSNYHDGGKAWRSLISPNSSSYQLIEEAKAQGSDCRPTCSRRISNRSAERLESVGKLGFFSGKKILARNFKGQKRGLPWFLGSDQLEMGKQHRLLSIEHTSRRAVVWTKSRLVQTRTATNTVTTSQTSASKSGADLLLRVERLWQGISSESVGVYKQMVPDRDDWWERIPENVSGLKSRIADKSPSAAKLIPEGSSSLRVERARAGPCYSKQEYAGTARSPIPFPSHRISGGIELKIAKGWGWLFNPACSNGAEARNSLWLLLGAQSGAAELIDISFLLRFRVGDQASGKNADGTLQTHSAFANSLGFGSWPEKVSRASVAGDRHLLANGTWPGGRWGLVFDLETRKVKTFIRNVENADDFGALALTTDGRTLIQANANGQLFFYDTSTGKVMLRGVETDDELIIYDENGYYLSSPEGSQFLNLKFPGIPGYSSVAQFASTLNRPDAIKAILAGRSAPRKPKLTAPPELRITAAVEGKGSTRQARLGYETGSEVGLKELIVFIDGRPERRLPLTGERAQGEVIINLSAEARWVSTVTVDRSGFRSIPRGQALANSTTPTSSRLFAISIGTDTYSDKRIKALKGAKRDAEQFAGLATLQKGKLYSSVEVIPLFDEPDLKGRLIDRIRATVSKARAEDTIMMFAAGHGDRGPDGRFYLLTGDSSLDALEQTSVSWTDIAEAFHGVKARVVIFLDACRSGAAGQSGTNDDVVAEILKEDAPITVIAASKGRQDSLETSEGGYFTRAILKAVYDDRAKTDSNGNGAIELAELYGVLKPSVVQSTGRKQTPWIARNQMVGEVPLF